MTCKKTVAQFKKEWPTTVRETGLVEIICPHGIGHPSKLLMLDKGREWKDWMAVHGCDGCCGLAAFALAELHHASGAQLD